MVFTPFHKEYLDLFIIVCTVNEVLGGKAKRFIKLPGTVILLETPMLEMILAILHPKENSGSDALPYLY